MEDAGKVRGEEADRIKQILTSLGKELVEKRTGVNPNQEDDNPEWTDDESATANAPWQQAKLKRKGSKLSPPLPKRTH